MNIFSVFLLASLAAASSSDPLTRTSSLQQTVKTVPPTWKFVHDLTSLKQALHPLQFTLVLKSADEDGLTRRMIEISESDGRWLSLDELKSYAAPTAESRAAVVKYLNDNGIDSSSMSFNDVGDHLKVQVEHVYPIASFISVKPRVRVLSSTAKNPPAPGVLRRQTSNRCVHGKITASCLRHFYGTDTIHPVQGTATLGIFQGYGEQFDPKQLSEFLSIYRPDIPDSYRVREVSVIHGYDNNATDVEGSETLLDMDTVVPQIYPLETVLYNVGNDSFPDNAFLTAIEYLISNPARPSVFSISYGGDESTMLLNDAVTTCRKIQQLTSLGLTVVSSSGDYGPTSSVSNVQSCPPFEQHFPATCPFVLSVGATAISDSGEEAMANPNDDGYYSGSSRSTFFPIPEYQAKALASYQTKLGDKNAGLYNPLGRSIPDVSIHGADYLTVQGFNSSTDGGTSESAPLMASLMTLLVGERNKTGKGPLGWVNPTLYKNPQIFKDIVKGGSYCLNGHKDPEGFPTTTGFDSASGLGSPRMQTLIKALG